MSPAFSVSRRTMLRGVAAGGAVAAFGLGSAPAFADARRQALVNDALGVTRKMVDGPEFPDLKNMVASARAVMIVPDLVMGGFIVGASGGRGVLLAKLPNGGWSYPAFYGMGSGSIGLQIGGKVAEIFLVVRNDKGLQAILENKFKFGASGGITVVTLGAGIEGATTSAGGADIVAFSKATGLFAGAALEGSYIDPDNDWNALYYGQGARTRAIVIEDRYRNPGAEPLRQHLAQYR